MKKDLKILFLAKYAPSYLDEFVSKKPEDLVYAQYHQSIWSIIKKNFPNTVSLTTPDAFLKQSKNFDYVFTLMNRMNFRNSEVFVSSVCEYLQVPYLGATPNIRAVAEDKHIAKVHAKHLGIQTPEWIVLNRNALIPKIHLRLPVFVKPRYGATSIDIDDSSICRNNYKLKEKIVQMQSRGNDLIIENYIEGEIYTVGVLNNFNKTLALPPVHEFSKNKTISYKEKRFIEEGLTRVVCSDNQLAKWLKTISLKYFSSLNPIDYARFDYIVNDEGIHFIEFNLCCNLGELSAISLAAKSIHIKHDALIHNILFSSLQRQNLVDCRKIYEF